MAAAVALAGCSQDEKFLRADNVSLEISAEDTAEQMVTIEASSPWLVDAVGGADWLNDAGTKWLSVKYDDNIPNLLWVKATETNDNLEDRRAVIRVASGDGLALDISFTQRAMIVRFNVSPSILEPFDAYGSRAQTITVDTGLPWEAFQLDGDWLTTTIDTEEDKNAGTLTVEAKDTRSLTERRDTIVLRPVREAYWSYSDSIAVVQAGSDLVVHSNVIDEETVEVEIPAEGGEVELRVQSRAEWSVSTEVPPERVALSPTEGGIDTGEGAQVVMTVTENTEEEEYRFTLTFVSAGKKYEYRCVQAGVAPEQEEPTPQE